MASLTAEREALIQRSMRLQKEASALNARSIPSHSSSSPSPSLSPPHPSSDPPSSKHPGIQPGFSTLTLKRHDDNIDQIRSIISSLEQAVSLSKRPAVPKRSHPSTSTSSSSSSSSAKILPSTPAPPLVHAPKSHPYATIRAENRESPLPPLVEEGGVPDVPPGEISSQLQVLSKRFESLTRLVGTSNQIRALQRTLSKLRNASPEEIAAAGDAQASALQGKDWDPHAMQAGNSVNTPSEIEALQMSIESLQKTKDQLARELDEEENKLAAVKDLTLLSTASGSGGASGGGGAPQAENSMAQLMEVYATFENLQGVMAEREEAEAETRREMDELRATVARLEGKYMEESSVIRSRHKGQISDLRTKNEKLRQMLADKSDAEAAALTELKQSKEIIASLTEARRMLQRDCKLFQNKTNVVIQYARSKLSPESVEEMEELTRQLAAAEQGAALEHEKETLQLNLKIYKLTQENASLKENQEKHAMQLAVYAGLNQALDNTILSYENEIDILQDAKSQLEHDNSLLKNQVASLRRPSSSSSAPSVAGPTAAAAKPEASIRQSSLKRAESGESESESSVAELTDRARQLRRACSKAEMAATAAENKLTALMAMQASIQEAIAADAGVDVSVVDEASQLIEAREKEHIDTIAELQARVRKLERRARKKKSIKSTS